MFKSFKTVVVTLTMLAVGYGAHVVSTAPCRLTTILLPIVTGGTLPTWLRDGQMLRPEISLDGATVPPHGAAPRIIVPVPAPGQHPLRDLP